MAFAPNTPNKAVNTAIANSTIFFQLIFFIIYKIKNYKSPPAPSPRDGAGVRLL
jgi:hypothetical protein